MDKDIPLFPPPQSRPVKLPRHDLTGQRFSHLVVLAFSHRDSKSTFWTCLCDCKNTTVVYAHNLRNGATTSCGCQKQKREHARKDVTAQRFGRLVVTQCLWIKGHGYAYAICDCGKMWYGEKQKLVRKEVMSCGCWRRESKRKDRTGQTFGKLFVQHIVWKNGEGFVQALCACGGQWSGPIQQLVSGTTTSCGCKQRLRVIRRKDLTGQRFGRLVVTQTLWYESQRHIEALCDCGEIWQGTSQSLVAGTTTSCGCLRRKTAQYKREKMRIANQLRAARKKQLPNSFGTNDLHFLFQYWKFRCAVCLREEGGLWHYIALDHFIPLNNPNSAGTVPWNIIPLCHTRKGAAGQLGAICCNNAKRDKDPVIWLTAKLGPRRAKAKLREVERYFALTKARSASCIAS